MLQKDIVNKILAFLKSNWSYILCFLFYFFLALGFVELVLGFYFRRIKLSDVFFCTSFIYAVCIGLAFSPIAERFMRYIKGAYEIETEEDKELLLPLFEEVREQALRQSTKISEEVKLYIAENKTVEAYTIGEKAIVINRGTIETFSSEELKSIIAHELGHIANGDAKKFLIYLVANGFFLFTILIYSFMSKKFKYLVDYFSKGGSIFGLIVLFLQVIIDLYIALFVFIGNILIAINSRKSEFLADDFAFDLELGEELKNVLYILRKLTVHNKVKLTERLKATHPHTGARIKRLESKLIEQE